jgi:NDP-sugar pyrophosphorylase family protein
MTSSKVFPDIIILAAGLGSRMREIGMITPKPLLPNKTDCLLKRQIEYFACFTKSISVTVGHRAAEVGEAALYFGANRVIDVGEGKENAEFLHSTSIQNIQGNFAVVTCDNLMTFAIQDLQILIEEGKEANVLVPINDTTGKSGDRLRLASNQTSIEKISKDPSLKKLASGLQVINQESLINLPTGLQNFNQFWNYQIDKGLLRVSSIVPKSWTCIDTPEDLYRHFPLE